MPMLACGNQLFSGSEDEVKEESRPYGPQACILASSRKSSQLPCSRRYQVQVPLCLCILVVGDNAVLNLGARRTR